ncbi:MAG: sigma-70 family RNA polymerase sigma factor [Microscillaceae bacterium]|nr:sigma-70 family RNA polymerase sigma factor [Microscillaceae bacterium]
MTKLKPPSETEWIRQIKAGQAEALQFLYEKHFPSISHFILANNGTSDEAKDVYQESVIIFYEKLQDPDFVLHCQIKTFLYSIARRLWLKQLGQKQRFLGNIQDHEAFLPFEEELSEIDEKEARFLKMEACMQKLGEPCRTILQDFYLHKASMQAIRDKMGYTDTDNAKTQKYKCLQRLKKLFFQEYVKP